MQRYGAVLVIGALPMVMGAVFIRIVGLYVASLFDYELYVNLLGRTMANPDWQPWWGYWLLWGGSLAGGALAGLVVVVVGMSRSRQTD